MAADARLPCVAKPSAAIILARWNRLVMVFHEEGFQLPGSFQCEGMIQIVNTKLAHKYSLLMHRIKIPANFYMEWIKRFCGWIYHFSISLTLAALQRQKSLPDIGDTTIQDAISLSSGLPLWSLASTPWVMSLYFKFRAIYFSDLSKTGHFIENASYILSWVTKNKFIDLMPLIILQELHIGRLGLNQNPKQHCIYIKHFIFITFGWKSHYSIGKHKNYSVSMAHTFA